MRKNIIISGFLAVAMLSTSCSDKFADINTNPETTAPEFGYLFTAGLEEMNMHDYFAWYWNYRVSMPWSQLVASSEGNTDQVTSMTELFEGFLQVVRVKKQVEAIKYRRSSLPADEAVIYAHLEAMSKPMVIYMGLLATDGSGSIPYSEAGKAYFIGEPGFRPKFDSQKELTTEWLRELKESVEILNNPVIGSDGNPVSQLILGRQDFVYGGDSKKWAKFANSLRLKIALRLLHQDKSLAIATVQDVMKYPIMETPADDFVWGPGSQWINTENGLGVSTGGIQIIDFLVKNKEPRVRFIFTKNQFNESIVNGFLQINKRLPSYIDKYVNRESDANGQKFVGWKEPGEPWVRYHGVPIDIRSKTNADFMQDYYTAENFTLASGTSQSRSYNSTSPLNEPMLRGGYRFSYPALPGATPKIDEQQKSLHFACMSAAEVNLYLVEFKVLDPASVPGDASTYYRNGIEYSVRMYDNLARLNRIPYYHESTALPTDATIDLKSNEIPELLTRDDYKLTGSREEQLERIYIQQYIHFAMYPLELFTTMRRSGVPIKDSSYYPLLTWDSMTAGQFVVPRRFMVRSLADTDELRAMREAALIEQGITPGKNDAATLSNERLWFDKGAPEYGGGPSY